MPSPEPSASPLYGRLWHQALAYALLGRIEPALGRQRRPDPALLVAELEGRYADGRVGLDEDIARARMAAEGRWPSPVPEELRTGLGPAQFSAAITELRHLLGVEGGPRHTLSGRNPDAAEQVLLREVPPHHGH